MKVKDLIEKLSNLDAELEILIIDHRQLATTDEDESWTGFYHFTVEEPDEVCLCASLVFSNRDYKDDGTLVNELYLKALERIEELEKHEFNP